ncbi:MAG: serine hydrolase domain-containing protein, partial [Acidimicrobiales bacterium]
MDADPIAEPADLAELADLEADLSAAIESGGFSGVVVVTRRNDVVLERAAGLADRANATPITLNTRLGTASCTKGFTALTIASLVGEGRLAFETRIVDLVGDALPAVDPAVTIEQLLGHTSGVGDYLDEEELG